MGLPWAGCTVLATDADALRELRAKAAAKEDILVVDMPEPAQTSRVYDYCLGVLAATRQDTLGYCAVSLVGPRDRVDKLVGRLALLR